ncbi:hypothetical protein WG936_02750 [Corynebacterium sp. H127]|uniref:hypothetical protein n=1 Tax=Corynebacterium sp. H127 TaxID=3133418 RepID=UPI0030A26385
MYKITEWNTDGPVNFTITLALFFLSFTYFKTVSIPHKFSDRGFRCWTHKEKAGLAGYQIGVGRSFLKNCAFPRENEIYKVALHGQDYLRFTEPGFLNQFAWVIPETFAAEERRRSED